ncbi:hypothetical protein A7M79_01490 [Acinetobacter baumannii]|uniref:hypothetical protein n=1 Tax=Acinetobacter baumannii TaxID=470 RepID=UPI0008DD2617|nr:hypothetical protein [Acinetobacter baumannii]OIH12189.1 hypothetical protein A7M79_01490 [Acinetobacter baumannii]
MDQIFRIYPSTEDYLADSSKFTTITGKISLSSNLFIDNEGNEYRLNLNKFSLNYALADVVLANPISSLTWFIPQDDKIWLLGYLKGDTNNSIYVFKEKDKYYSLKNGNLFEVENIVLDNKKRNYIRCNRVIMNDGLHTLKNCFIWETPNFIYHRVADKNRRYHKETHDKASLPVAYIDDGDEVIGYIYQIN